MILLCRFLITFLCVFAFGKKLPMPKKNPEVPASMMKSLHTKVEDFKVLSHLSFSEEVLKIASNHPAKVFGDFNDDGVQDGAFFGYSQKKKKMLVLAAVSRAKKGSFQVEVIHQIDFMKNHETTNYGEYLNVGLKNPKEGRQRDVLQWESYGQGPASVSAFYYSKKDKKFKPFINTMD